jgi:peptide chain release factor 1
VPPTETKGRTHTSTVTVVVTEAGDIKPITFKDDDFRIETKRGSGKGGQHRNKTDSMVVMTHIATGLKASVDGRNQHFNKREARRVVEQRVREHYSTINYSNETDLKKTLAGSGERGDKIRTYRYQDGIVTDHRTGRKCNLQDLIDGKFEKVL